MLIIIEGIFSYKEATCENSWFFKWKTLRRVFCRKANRFLWQLGSVSYFVYHL